MDRYDRDEPPSIFPQSEDAMDDAQPASSASSLPYIEPRDAASRLTIGSGNGRGSQPPTDGPSRRLLVAVGAGGILIIGLIGYVGASVLRLADDPGNAAASATASLDPSATPSASPSPTPLAAIPSSSAGPSPTLRPQPATPLLAGQWATVVTDLVNLRATPRLAASVVGQAGRGEIVFILASESPVEIDGFTWYQVVADPNEVGWVAGHGPTEQLLRSDAPSAEIVWCGLLTAPVIRTEGQELGDEAVVAGLPVPTSVLGRGASAALELMWGAQIPTCVSLTIDAGTTSAGTVDLEESFCAVPWFGAMATSLEMAGGEDGPRSFTLDDRILGTAYADGVLANIEDVMTVAGVGSPPNQRPVCLDIIARGGGEDTTIEATATTDACVRVYSASGATVSLLDPDGVWMVDLDRTAESELAPELNEYARTGILVGIRLSARRGAEGAFSLQPTTIEGC